VRIEEQGGRLGSLPPSLAHQVAVDLRPFPHYWNK
jgi:hypothetical protein